MLLVGLPVLLAGVPGGVPAVGGVAFAASGRTFYVDCDAGSDASSGLVTTEAWRSLGPPSRALLGPGDSVLLKRGCHWQSPLTIDGSGTAAQPLTIGAYGDGDLPVVENAGTDIAVNGSYVVVEDVHVRADAPTVDRVCQNQRAGTRFGIRLGPGASHDTVQDSLITELYSGVRLDLGSHDNRIVHNVFKDNNMKSDVASSDAGAVAIDLQSDNNEIGYNTISGSDACSHFFNGRDGSAISVFGGRGNVIHHNLSLENHDFIEVGDPRSRDNLIIYNADRSSLVWANFLVVHGDNSKYGPVLNTRAGHNTSVLTGANSASIITVGDVTGVNVSVHANILWDDATIAGGQNQFDEGDNIFWASNGHPNVGFRLSPSTQLVDPRLVDALGGDFHLLPDSPAIDAVRPLDLGPFGAVDMAGTPVPQGFEPDIGAYEFVEPQAPASSGDQVGPGPGSTGAPIPGSTARPLASPAPTPAPGAIPELTPAKSSDGGLLLPLVIVLGVGAGAAILLLLRRRGF